MKGSKRKSIAKATPVKLVLAVRPTWEFADQYPAWASLTLHPELIERVLRLQKLCIDENLASVADRNWWPEEWAHNDTHHIVGDQLIVTKDEAWFSAHPKHAAFDVETHEVKITVLARIAWGLARRTPEGFLKRNGVYFFDSSGLLNDLLEQYEGSHAKT